MDGDKDICICFSTGDIAGAEGQAVPNQLLLVTAQMLHGVCRTVFGKQQDPTEVHA